MWYKKLLQREVSHNGQPDCFIGACKMAMRKFSRVEITHSSSQHGNQADCSGCPLDSSVRLLERSLKPWKCPTLKLGSYFLQNRIWLRLQLWLDQRICQCWRLGRSVRSHVPVAKVAIRKSPFRTWPNILTHLVVYSVAIKTAWYPWGSFQSKHQQTHWRNRQRVRLPDLSSGSLVVEIPLSPQESLTASVRNQTQPK